MVALRSKPLGLLGWLLSVVLDWAAGDSREPEAPTRASLA